MAYRNKVPDLQRQRARRPAGRLQLSDLGFGT
jgi:hypothetical protein